MEDNQDKIVFDAKSTFTEQVDKILDGADSESSHLEILKVTPPLLRMVGVPNLPILMTAKHLKTITRDNGQERANYHGLGVEIVKRLPELLSDPVMIMDSISPDENAKNSVVIVTQTVDKENRPVIGAIKLAGKGYINSIELDANVLTSAYGKDNFQSFIARNIEQDSVLYVDKEKSQEMMKIPGIQFPDNFATLDFNTIIRKTKAFVNTNLKNNLETTKKEEDMANTNNQAQSARERVQQIRDDMVKTLLEHIEKNPQNWQSGWNNIAAGAPYNGKTNTAYRGLNSLYLAVIGMQRGYKDTRWVTFNQAKELGASVKKGEKSAPVIFFEYYDRATKKAFDSRTVKDMTDEEKQTYMKENVYAVLKYSSVFNAEQCYNFPERKEIAMSEEERANQNIKIETIIANSGAPVLYDGGSQAYYSPGTDSIHLPKIEAFDSMQDYYATALHEIAHSTGHQSRLNRDMGGGFGSESYAKEELRAELACVFMQMENGVQLNGKHITNHAAYLNSWLEAAKKDTSVFFKAAADAQRIADYVEQNYTQAVNSNATENGRSAQNNPMAERLQGEEHKREVEQETLNRVSLETNIREWYISAYPNDEVGQDIHPDATFKDLQEQVEDYNHPSVYGMLGEDSVIRERAFAKLAEITNTTYEAVYSTYMGETAAQKLANARAQALQLAKETGEPYVTIEWTEKSEGFPSINPYEVMSLSEADKKLSLLDAQAEGDQGYYKTKLHIDFVFEGKPDSYENCRFDIGSEHGGLVHHIDQFLKYDTFLDTEERAEAEAALEYFRCHMEVSEYLADPKILAELSEEEQKAVNEYVERARDVLNTTAPFADYKQKMPPTPEDIADAIYGYSWEKPELSLQDCIDEVHEMSAATVKQYAKDYRAYLDSSSKFMNDETEYLTNYSAKDLFAAWRKNAQAEGDHKENNLSERRLREYSDTLKRNDLDVGSAVQSDEYYLNRAREEISAYEQSDEYREAVRQDFPHDFEDDFTEAMLDDIEEGNFLTSKEKDHDKKLDNVSHYSIDFTLNYGNEMLLSNELKVLGYKKDTSLYEKNEQADSLNAEKGTEHWLNAMRYIGADGKSIEGFYGRSYNGIMFEATNITGFTTTGLNFDEVNAIAEVVRDFGVDVNVKEIAVQNDIQEQGGNHKEKTAATASISKSADANNEKTIAEELSQKSVWLKVNLSESAIGGQYGNNTLVRMPDGEYSHFAVFIPSKFIKNENGKVQVNVGSKFTYRLSNDGREVNLTGQELADSFAGKKVGKEIVRVAPSRKYAQTLANLEKNVPVELKEIPTWCCYRTKWNEEKGKKDKFIISPIDGKWTSSKELGKWVTFDTALKYARENNCEGLSLLLNKQYGITCIDLDKCITDAKTGAMKERATKLVKELGSTYIERSTSGNGVHIFLKDDILKNGTYKSTSMVKDEDPKGDLEVFDDKHIISMTGDMLSANNNLTRAGSAATVYLRQELGTQHQQTSSGTKPQAHGNMSDRELIQWIQKSKMASKFNDLYNGKGLSGDRSADDGKLAHMLLYFNGGDKEQAFRIMRESGLNRTDKPDSYYRHTIDKMDEKISEYAKRPSLGASKQQSKSAAGKTKPGAQA